MTFLKFKSPEQTDIAKMQYSPQEIGEGVNIVNFSYANEPAFRLIFDYDKTTKCGIITHLKMVEGELTPFAAAALETYIIGQNKLSCLRLGFGENEIIGGFLQASQFLHLIKIRIVSANLKAIAIAQSISKLQDSFEGNKFTLVRLT